MKIILLLAAMLSNAFAVDCQIGDPTCTGSETSSSTSTSTGTERADNWKSSKYSDDALRSGSVGSTVVTQGNSFTLKSNLLYGCVETSLLGRTDDLCKNSPDHPECTGLTRSIENATSCMDPINPGPGVKCKVYGKAGYTMDEWLAFGEQYQKAMNDCFELKIPADATATVDLEGQKVARLASLTAFQQQDKMDPGTTTASISASGISGDIDESNLAGLGGQGSATSGASRSLTSIDDGATALGYEKGEIVKRTMDGQAFYHIVTNSPFASELTPKQLSQMENGLAESSLVISKARTAGRIPSLGGPEILEGGQLAGAGTQDASSGASSWAKATAGSAARGLASAPTGSANSAAASATPSEMQKIAAALAANPAYFGKRKLMLAERIAMLENAARAHNPIAQRGLAAFPSGAPKPKSEGFIDPEITLFVRVSAAYKRKSKQIAQASGASAGVELRRMPSPFLSKGIEKKAAAPAENPPAQSNAAPASHEPTPNG